LLGPVPGVVIGVVTCAVHALLMGDFWGGLMNAAAVTVFVLVSSGIYWRGRDTKHAVLGLSAATLVNVPAMVCLGLAVTPIYTGWPVEQVIGMLLPVVVPFNLGKGAANAVLAFALLKPTESALSSKR
jgi:riboflavin transporter FmnP